MYPTIAISDIRIGTYYVFIFIAILAFILSTKLLIRNKGWINFDFPYYICFIFIFGFLGSKVFYLLEDLDFTTFKKKISNIKNGYVLFGGLIFVFLSSFYYAKVKKIRSLTLLDLNTIAFCLSICIGKLACLASGCCYGVPTSYESIALVYRDELCLAFPKNEPLFPIQIIDSVFALLLFLVFLYLNTKNKVNPGKIFLTFCITYPMYRFISEYFRADISRGFVFNGLLSLSQLYSLITLCMVLFFWGMKQYYSRYINF